MFDAATGEYRRMWGAFGNEAVDDPPAEDLERMAAGQPGDGPQQFSGVPHNIGVSNDGIVYVSDRGNRRIQAFTTDGEYLAQGFVNRDAEGLTTAGIAFSTDPGQRFLYTPDFHWGHIWILDRKDAQGAGPLRRANGGAGRFPAAARRGHRFAGQPVRRGGGAGARGPRSWSTRGSGSLQSRRANVERAWPEMTATYCLPSTS